jgi:hypothetical protein
VHQVVERLAAQPGRLAQPARVAGQLLEELRDRLGRRAVAEQQIGPRLGEADGAIVRVGLDRVEEFDPGGARLTLGQGRDAAPIALLGRRRGVRAGRRHQHRREQGEAPAHGCSPYCLSKS